MLERHAPTYIKGRSVNNGSKSCSETLDNYLCSNDLIDSAD